MVFAITISSGAIQTAIRQLCVQPLTGERFFCSFRSCFSLVSHDLRWCIAGCDRVSEPYKAVIVTVFPLVRGRMFFAGFVIFHGLTLVRVDMLGA